MDDYRRGMLQSSKTVCTIFIGIPLVIYVHASRAVKLKAQKTTFASGSRGANASENDIGSGRWDSKGLYGISCIPKIYCPSIIYHHTSQDSFIGLIGIAPISMIIQAKFSFIHFP